MTTSLRTARIFCAFVVLIALAGAAHALDAITPQAQDVIKVLDAMGVETKWVAGERVHWDTGLPTGVPETSPGKHTHCSAFVAAAAKNLGVYILRPPEHGQKLLANAQNEWLAQEGASNGWLKLANAAKHRLPPIVGCWWSQVTTIITTTGPAISPSCARATRRSDRSQRKGRM